MTSRAIDGGALDCILSNLSQELCRPLESLRAGFNLLLVDGSKGVGGDQQGHVRTMAELCDELLRLTRHYLDYAGLVHGVLPLCMGTFTLGALIREIDREFAAVAASRRITWKCMVDAADTTVATDASLCQQVLGNLVDNALKYTAEGGEVCLRAKYEGKRWSVTVSDNGPGVPVEHLERVFEPFFRLARDEQSGAVGNGLGLAICKRLVSRLGGTIELTCAKHGGTDATVSFPDQVTCGVAPEDRP